MGNRPALRLSPFGHYNSMPHAPLGAETFFYLCTELSRRGVAYIHLLYELMPKGNMREARFDQQYLPDAFVKKTRELFTCAIIWCGSFNKEMAQATLRYRILNSVASAFFAAWKPHIPWTPLPGGVDEEHM